jgi:hypothetical protein
VPDPSDEPPADAPEPGPRVCDLCRTPVRVGEHYVVRIDVFADPEIPPMSGEELASASFDSALDALINELEELGPEEAEAQVFHRFEYRLCPACRKRFVANPLGLPRAVRKS